MSLGFWREARAEEGKKGIAAAHLSTLPFPPDSLEPLDDLPLFLARQNPHARERLGIRDRPTDISGMHTLVISERLIERVHPVERVSSSPSSSPTAGEGNAPTADPSCQ
jgi:hypothetical protein